MINRLLSSICLSATLAGLPVAAMAQTAEPENLAQIGTYEELVSKAQAEGSLMIYGAPSQDKMERWLRGFTEEFGIEVQYYRAPSNTVYQRFEQEQRANRNLADILSLSDLAIVLNGVESGYIAAYTPQTEDQFPESMVEEEHAYPLFLSVSTVGWNTRVVPEDLQQKLFEDPLGALLDPRLKDKIAVTDVTAGGSQLATNANIIYNQEAEYGWDYLAKLADNGAVVVRSSTAILDGVIAGDFWATTDAYTSLFAAKVAEGAPLAFQAPEPAATSIFYTSVAANAPHPHAARLFTEWALTLDAQQSLTQISAGESAMNGWVDSRGIIDFEWYRPAKELYVDWQRDERLQGEALTEFYARWAENYGN